LYVTTLKCDTCGYIENIRKFIGGCRLKIISKKISCGDRNRIFEPGYVGRYSSSSDTEPTS